MASSILLETTLAKKYQFIKTDKEIPEILKTEKDKI